MNKIITVKKIEIGERIDSFLAKKMPEFSRSHYASMLKSAAILVNNTEEKSSYKIKENDQIKITISDQKNSEILPENIKLDIVYENENVIVINKQPGIVVHPATGNPKGTLVNALLAYYPEIKNAVIEKGNTLSESRPGVVHRLDQDTSGVMIFAKNLETMHFLSKQIKDRKIEKTYLALCYGWPKKDHDQVVSYLGRHPKNRKMMTDVGESKGKKAVSNYKVSQYFSINKDKASLIEFNIQTGRTHQIRTQAKALGFPVIGDLIYNSKDSVRLSKGLGAKRQLLHSYKLVITLPNNDKPSEFIAPIHPDLESIRHKLHLDY